MCLRLSIIISIDSIKRVDSNIGKIKYSNLKLRTGRYNNCTKNKLV